MITTEVTTPVKNDSDSGEKIFPVTTKLDNGDVLVENEDGTKILTKSDGTIIETDPSGLEITRFANGDEEFNLSDGRRVHIKVGNGNDAEKAQRFIGHDSVNENAYMRGLMSMLVKIDGKSVVYEDLGTMHIKHYMRIRTRFMIVNF